MKQENFDALPPLERMLYELIDEIQNMHRANHTSPDFATLTQIHNGLKAEILEALRSMYLKGLLEFHRSINGMEMFALKDTSNE